MTQENSSPLTLEVELKYRLTGKNPIAAILAVLEQQYGPLAIQELHQTNAFFDTAHHALRAANITLRLRKQNADYFLTVKGNAPSLRTVEHLSEKLEYEVILKPTEATALLNGQQSVFEWLQKHPGPDNQEATRRHFLQLIHTHASQHPIRYVGSFTNLRRAVPIIWNGLKRVLEFDTTTFPGNTVHEELELELHAHDTQEIEATNHWLQTLFTQAGVQVETSNGKSERFFAFLASPPRPLSDTKGPPSFRVPDWTKVAFFWFGLLLLGGLIYTQIDKRIAYKRLFLAHFMQASPNETQAPLFTLPKGQNGETVSLAQTHGQWRLVHFWATWCPPCREEMPSLVSLQQRMGNRLKVMAISIDEDYSNVLQFFHHQQLPFDVLWDPKAQVAKTYQVAKYPETFLLSPDGTIVAHFDGPRPWNRQEAIDYLLQLQKTPNAMI